MTEHIINEGHFLDFQKFTAGKQKDFDRPRPDKSSSGRPLHLPTGRSRFEPGKSSRLIMGPPIIKKGHFLDFQKITAGKQKDVDRPRPYKSSSERPLYLPTGRSRHESGKSSQLIMGAPIIKKGHFLNFQKLTAGKQKDVDRPGPYKSSSGRPLYILTGRSRFKPSYYHYFFILLWGLP